MVWLVKVVGQLRVVRVVREKFWLVFPAKLWWFGWLGWFGTFGW